MNLNDLSMRNVQIEGVDQFLWPTKDFNAFHWPMQDWIQGRAFFMEFVKERDTVVQAGGCCGMYPRFYKNYFKTVYTFEPDPVNFHCLTHNCPGPGYHIFNAALGAENKMVSMDAPTAPGEENNVGMYTINETPGQINMLTLDSLNIPRCDLLHLDLEEYETNALKGAVNLIEKFNPVIIVERQSGREFLESIGYHLRYKLSMDSIFVRGWA